MTRARQLFEMRRRADGRSVAGKFMSLCLSPNGLWKEIEWEMNYRIGNLSWGLFDSNPKKQFSVWSYVVSAAYS